MKKISTLIAFIIIAAAIAISCCGGNNQGYGYNTTAPKEQGVNTTTESKDIFERAAQRHKNYHMTLCGLDGKSLSSCTAYKGEFDGHTWYVFYDNLASPSVVHDPLCKCKSE